MLFICYPKCDTCTKARKWLDDNHIKYDERNIKEDKPSRDELNRWHKTGGVPIRKFFNTSGQLYKSMGLKEKFPLMSDEEQLRLLASDGMLVKRPVLVDGDTVLTGFREHEWKQLL